MAGPFKARRALVVIPCLVAAGLACGVTLAIASEPIPASVRMCRSQVDAGERLHCYDAAVDNAATTATAPGAASAQRRPVESASTGMAPPVSAPVATTGAATPRTAAMFSAKITALTFRPSGAVNVTLDNGEVWTQYGPEGRVPLKAGDTVILRPGLFGASVLVGPSGWITKVHPVPATPAAP